MNILYIMGKSSSGKDTIFNVLKNELDIKDYVSYTTRPIRSGEIDGKTYHYITDTEMQEYIDGKKENKLIEKRTYQTVHGPWTYATISDEQFKTDKDLIMLGTLESYLEMKKHFSDELLPIYIEVEDGLRLERALNREKQQQNPRYTELCRRFLADSKDFSEENLEKAGVTKKFQNIDLDICVNEILTYIKSREKESSIEER